MGMLLGELYDENTFVRLYISLMLKLAPRKYRRLLKTGKALGLLCIGLILFAFAKS